MRKAETMRRPRTSSFYWTYSGKRPELQRRTTTNATGDLACSGSAEPLPMLVKGTDRLDRTRWLPASSQAAQLNAPGSVESFRR